MMPTIGVNNHTVISEDNYQQYALDRLIFFIHAMGIIQNFSTLILLIDNYAYDKVRFVYRLMRCTIPVLRDD